MKRYRSFLTEAATLTLALCVGVEGRAGTTVASDGSREATSASLQALDAGVVVVELGGGAPLALTAHGAELRVDGGTPGNVGVLLVGGSRGALRPAIAGRFGEDGSLAISLAEVAHDVFVQGVELTPAGPARSDVRWLGPSRELVDPDAAISGSEVVARAVDQALRAAGEAPAAVQFVGSSRRASRTGSVDAALLLGRTEAGFTLTLPPALARRTALGDSGARFLVDDARELAGAVEAVIALDAFSGLEGELERAHARLDAARARHGGGGRAPISRPGSGPLPHSGPLGQAGDVLVDLTPDFGAHVVDHAPIPQVPQRAGDKLPPIGHRDGAARDDRPLDQAGDVVVDLTPLDPGTRVTDLEPIPDLPQRAGDKLPPVSHRDGNAARQDRPVPDAGPRSVDPTPDDHGAQVVDHEPIPDAPRQAGDKRPPIGQRDGSAARNDDPLREADGVVVDPTPLDPGTRVTDPEPILDLPQRAGDKLPPVSHRDGNAARQDRPVPDAGPRSVDPTPDDHGAQVVDHEPIPDAPQQAGDKLPPIGNRDSGAARNGDPLREADGVVVDPTPLDPGTRVTDPEPIPDLPQRAGDKLPAIGHRDGGAAPRGGPPDETDGVVVDLSPLDVDAGDAVDVGRPDGGGVRPPSVGGLRVDDELLAARRAVQELAAAQRASDRLRAWLISLRD